LGRAIIHAHAANHYFSIVGRTRTEPRPDCALCSYCHVSHRHTAKIRATSVNTRRKFIDAARCGVKDRRLKMTVKNTKIEVIPEPRARPLGRYLAFGYGLVSYAVSVVTLLYTIGFVANLYVAKSIDVGPAPALHEALLVNLLLMVVFAIQHSVMARQQFKAWWTQYVPKAVERSTYVLITSLCLALLIWQWHPITAVVWQVENPDIAIALVGLSLFGWVIMLTSSFLINHFELFGLHQVANNLADKPMPAPRFYTPLFYKFVRHPLYLGLLIAFWVTPTMTLGHLFFAAVLTIYIFMGILLEERDLVGLFGDEYRRYKERVSMIVPWRKSS
jgi:methanethiol S-methyltransferase